ncbi:hypothetical protein PCL_00062 [Purpureocillium lilacinum]|uniref:Fcf2 pre-rRNA processing C-terminal domain-containing protein n=1 Tax=Purpureocillium lilacinum TaxID=33203 RepID=A0A2U3E5W4_PURLI|nr:hypothetical protein Purlil1_5740 [Purpureocillium lilacinum]PWI69918.1 hypothetical protein PCL_00062 [Purpureocillium lilacinum]
MPNLVDDRIEELLKEAEHRLRGSDAPALPSPVAQPIAVQPTTKKAAPREALSVRPAQSRPATNASKKDTAGPNWFGLPKTDLTPEFKRDWQLLRMRGLLDPKHQKKALRSAPPEYSQVGEVIAGPADYYSARLSRKDRKRTIFEEVAAAHDKEKLSGKYAGIQRNKTSGKKAFYQRLVSQRRKRQG